MPLRISKNRVALEGIPLNLSAEVTVASATPTIGAVTVLSNNILISGTSGITSFGSATTGTDRYLRFEGALLLTNSANLILPGGNITTVAGDRAHFVCLGTAGTSSNWFCRNYARASGMALTVVNLVTEQTNNWTKGQRGFVTPLNDASTIAINLADSNNFSLLMTSAIGATRILGNSTTTPVAGQSGIIAVTQDVNGLRAMTYGTNYKFVGGVVPVLSTGAGQIDYLSYYVETTSRIFISIIKNAKNATGSVVIGDTLFAVGTAHTIRPYRFGSFGTIQSEWNTYSFASAGIPLAAVVGYPANSSEDARGNPGTTGVGFSLSGLAGVYEITLAGAGGAGADPGWGAPGGLGTFQMTLAFSDIVHFYIGQGGMYSGGVSRASHAPWYYPNPGGWNGGGAAGAQQSSTMYSGSGGGGTDVRLNGTTLAHRIAVVGGGGGATDQNLNTGGQGGGLNNVGQQGGYVDNILSAGQGGTLSAGGAGAVEGGSTGGLPGGLWFGGAGLDSSNAGVESANAAGGGGGWILRRRWSCR